MTETHTKDKWNELIRKGRKDKKKKIPCGMAECDNGAWDVHHIDSSHKNNAPENLMPICKLCHNFEHGITAEMTDLKILVRQFYDFQDQRKALSNRVGAYESLGIELPWAEESLESIKKMEEQLGKQLGQVVKQFPIYTEWLSKVKGIGPRLAACLIGELGSPRFDTVSAMWAYCGQAVNGDGEAVRRKKGVKSNWNPRLKMTCWKIGEQFVKVKDCLGRDLYDQYKVYYIDRDGETPKWKPHSRAKRRAVKHLLRCFYIAWREMEGLPITEADPRTVVFPGDWIYTVD